jgi:GNAT superfamily N-acetyltransferase
MASTRLLAEVPEVNPTIANWYKTEWASWFADMPLAEVEADFVSIANADKLPLGIIALDSTAQPVGVCSLRADPFEPYPYAGPWLRGLYVHGPQRGSGIAGELIRAAEHHASRLGIPKLFAATHNAIGCFERAGWLGFDQVQHEQQTLTIFAKRTA